VAQSYVFPPDISRCLHAVCSCPAEFTDVQFILQAGRVAET